MVKQQQVGITNDRMSVKTLCGLWSELHGCPTYYCTGTSKRYNYAV